jgi:hypothetical protein
LLLLFFSVFVEIVVVFAPHGRGVGVGAEEERGKRKSLFIWLFLLRA